MQIENDRARKKNGFTAGNSCATDRTKRVTLLFTGISICGRRGCGSAPLATGRIVRLTSPGPIGYSDTSAYLRAIHKRCRITAISFLASSFLTRNRISCCLQPSVSLCTIVAIMRFVLWQVFSINF